MNTLKTGLLLAAMTALFVAVGGLFGGRNGMIIAFGFALVMNFISYWFSDKIVLAMQGAQELTPQDAPELFRTVERLTANAGLPMPRIYVIPGEQPNAFATGRDPNNAAVAVTESIVALLTPAELEGVLAHELAHVRNRDILISTVAATIAGGISFLVQIAQWGLLFGGYNRDDREGGMNPLAALLAIILAPIAAFLIQMAISRSREFEADATGARLSGKPLALASALRKIEAYAEARPLPINPSTAHMYIINPLRAEGIYNLFRSHPPTAERIARLQAIASQVAA
ncbi:MAG TPA: zinc metalloprotease HtpX [Chthonomonadaceae bacterium]|nr:zinc metalloprotease HtpX [Chthonomonadaceae bacterium]